ncbi:hypothetical protein [Pseudoxanthomonas koreensis]|uniref:hypothetical protein n=1 Tax=Pseudoxanthomonas koreensis TaxID=266061 RepID=UPI001391EA4D|nr:hypothetical protein [Pseudoxanthomonas koreensis]
MPDMEDSVATHSAWRLIAKLTVAVGMLGLLASCGDEEAKVPGAGNIPSGEGTSAHPAPAGGFASEAVSLRRAYVGPELTPSGELNVAATEFEVSDQIYLGALLDSVVSTPIQVRYEVLNETGNEVAAGSATASSMDRLVVKLEPIDGSFPPGDYTAKVVLNGVPSWEVRFSVVR